MAPDSMIRLKCESQLELDLLLELINQHQLAPLQVSKTSSDGIEIILRITNDLDASTFFSKLMLYDIYYTNFRN
ncbi:MAG: hypothetical protein LCH54_14815 [Bacteroidetes bacterium]|nr:hypothetical protein [Bacteroidota bacterium]